MLRAYGTQVGGGGLLIAGFTHAELAEIADGKMSITKSEHPDGGPSLVVVSGASKLELREFLAAEFDLAGVTVPDDWGVDG